MADLRRRRIDRANSAKENANASRRKAIIGAVAVIVREQRAANRAIVTELTARIEQLQTRLAALKRDPSRRLRAVGE